MAFMPGTVLGVKTIKFTILLVNMDEKQYKILKSIIKMSQGNF